MSEAPRQGIQSWALPRVTGPLIGQRRGEELRVNDHEAFEAALAAGRETGLAAARGEQQHLTDQLRQRVARLDTILDALGRPLAELDASIHHELATLAGAIARQLVRRELRMQPDQIVAVIRETLGLLPGTARDVTIHLHPEDAALVRERLAEPNTQRAWTLSEDPVISRGGCRVTSGDSTIDAQVEARLGAAIAAALGDERGTTAGERP